MSTASFADLPERGPGLRAKVSADEWDVLAKDAIATVHTEPDACEECKPYDGDTMRMGEAEDLIPLHPNCRCWYTWDWRPELRTLPVTALATRASERPTTIMKDTDTIHKSVYAESIVEKTPNGKDDGEYLKVPISSTGTDRDGDSFSEDGLKDLRDQIRETSKPVFENHGFGEGGLFGVRYDWKGIIGSQDDAEIEADGEEQTLYSYILPNEQSEEGALLASYVKAGMPVGLSIGFRPLEFESNDDDEHVFHKTDLLETSAVGIQSNQESVAGRGATDTAAALAKGVAGGLPDADLDEGTLAKAIVSELFARGAGGADVAGGAGGAEPETRDLTMGSNNDDDPTDEYVTREGLEKTLEKYLGEPDGDESDADDEAKDAETDLEAAVRENKDALDELTATVKEAAPAASETANKSDDESNANDPDDGEGNANGTNDETAADNEDATEEGDTSDDASDEDDDEDGEKSLAVGDAVVM